ncbi:unnamed protein product [Adineta steineri]|uniref:Uncharacterized protein n=1 Tax=Adineta steineri TaxID=433720 RepID=A0A818GU17_9BILA|nr:unnamed protein product [Adineta steineri]CAF3497320.1 unnamed protein product [Adineta steineri]CAF3512791.1 unnamed protein product [Adineta steineri]
MRRNHLSLILPDKKYHSTTSLSSTHSYHLVQSAEISSTVNESFYEDYCKLSKRRKSSVHQYAQVVFIEYSSNSNRSTEQFIRAGNCLTTVASLNNLNENKIYTNGETLIHLSSRLGHEHILRRLIQETPYATRLTNGKGQTPLLCAIQSSYSSTASFLMDFDPLTITVSDKKKNSIFHYSAYLSNDIVLSKAIILIKRLNSQHLRTQALSRLIEENIDGKTAFLISIEKGSIRCNRLFLSTKIVDLSLFLNKQSVRCAIDNNRIDIMTYWLLDNQRFEMLLSINVDEKNNYNLFEYSIENEKIDFIYLFLKQEFSLENLHLKVAYKNFLNNFNKIDQLTPIQRLLNRNNMIYLIPYLLDQFLYDNYSIDLSIIDDCLNNCPKSHRCLFGHTNNNNWSKQNWLKQHPLRKIAKISHKSLDDHLIIRLCVDLKYQLFGNILYLFVIIGQFLYVILYTIVIIFSSTISIENFNYYSYLDNTCNELCFKLINNKTNHKFIYDKSTLRIFRTILLIISFLNLIKEAFQLITQKNKYFQKFFINLLEIHMYISGIIYGIDLNECTRQTGIRCYRQWQIGAIGLLSVWTSLLLVLMKGIKCGKHGLLFITVLLTFLKFIFYYIFIWIGFYLAFYILLKDIFPQFNSLYLIAKLLVMFSGEFDMDETFFPNNVLIKGSEGALFVYSAFIFTMFIVMSNIMGGLAVADVKEFRLNAKREHLRSRIETILQLQTNLGFLCEISSKILLKCFHKYHFLRFLFKYDMSQLEIINENYSHVGILTQTGLLKSSNLNKKQKINGKSFIDKTNLILKKQNELKEYFEESIFITNNQLRKLNIQLKSDIEELKRHLDQHLDIK